MLRPFLPLPYSLNCTPPIPKLASFSRASDKSAYHLTPGLARRQFFDASRILRNFHEAPAASGHYKRNRLTPGDTEGSGMAVRGAGVLGRIHRLWDLGTFAGLTDAQLLARFANRHEDGAESAFEVLMERHGSMVFRICHGVLNDEHAAEDAFQATFLVLARKARSLWVKDSLASW
ncbi:RNA polymerase sigma factor, partial [Singulisphaera rosea]